jgi:hypothetical protein
VGTRWGCHRRLSRAKPFSLVPVLSSLLVDISEHFWQFPSSILPSTHRKLQLTKRSIPRCQTHRVTTQNWPGQEHRLQIRKQTA